MKKLFTLLFAIVALSIAGTAQNVCTVDNNNTKFGITPNDTTAPHIIRGTAFDTVAQIYVPDSVQYMGYTATILWLNIDSVNNFPTGITFQRNPLTSDTILGGGRQCILLSGTTMDPVGQYNLNFFGHVRVHVVIVAGVFAIDTTVSLAQVGSQFGYFLTVDGGVGIHDIGSNFNSSLNVYPNPTSGKFDLTLSNVDNVNGEVAVYDMTGRKVYAQKVEALGFYNTSIDLSGFAKGIYSVQVRTEKGVATKNISVE
jgi:hypothetical protein